MRDLLTLAAYESLSIFDQVMYRQIDGVTMGSSWVRFLRMQFSVILKNWFSECSPNILHRFFIRYVDGISVLFLCQWHLKDFLNYMNIKYPNIKFTSEFEENYSFSFLDVKVTRTNNPLVISVFRKATFGDVFTNFECFMPAT